MHVKLLFPHVKLHKKNRSKEASKRFFDKKMINPTLIKILFKDIADNDKFYNEIQICYSLGIINGIEKDKFCPDESLNRAQMCQMIYKLINKLRYMKNNLG